MLTVLASNAFNEINNVVKVSAYSGSIDSVSGMLPLALSATFRDYTEGALSRMIVPSRSHCLG